MYRIILILIFTLSLNAKDSFKPKITFGGNYNAYIASFKELPNVPNCCDMFENGAGIGFGLGLGFDYIFDNKLFGVADYYSFGINYRDLSGVLEKEVVSGNLIREFDFEPAYSNISLDISLAYIYTSHYLNFTPDQDLPIDLFINFDIGFASGGTYEQKEEAIRPNDYSFENGARVRDESNGDIQDLNSLFVAFGAGVKYNSIDLGRFELIPELSYQYSVLPVVNSLDWNVSSVQLGISLRGFNSPEKEPLPPPTPEPIPQKEPIIAKVEPLEAEIMLDSPKGIFNNKISYNLTKETYKEIYYLPPVIYFDKNEVKPLELKSERAEDKIYGNQDDLLKSIGEEIRNGENVAIKFSSTQDSAFILKRVEYIIDKLDLKNSESEKIKIEIALKDQSEFKYPELAQEFEKAEFKISGNELIEYEFKNYEKLNTNEKVDINFEIVTNKKDPYINSYAKYNEREIELPKKDVLRLSSSDLIDFYLLNDQDVTFSSIIESGDQRKELQRTVEVEAQVKNEEYLNFQSEKNESQFILGFFNFDESEFAYIDKNTREIVEKALEDNKKVTFYPLTDNLGADNYNSNLSQARLNSALSLFNNNSKIQTVIPKEPFFDNRHPFGRSMNRTIVVRISDK